MLKELLGAAFLAWPLVLVVLIVLAFVLTISVSVFVAGRTGFNKWAAAFIGFLIIYLAILWDWIPTVMTHRYYCEKEAGFWTYKTLDEWKDENPGVTLTLEGRATSTQKEEDGYKQTHKLNQRFNWVIEHQGVSSVLQVSKRKETLVDTKNNSVLARFVDFSSGNQRSTGTTKFWLVNRNCNGGENYKVRMGELVDELYAEAKGDKK